ncbi:MAG: 3-oxoacyl-[acyl-carrier-protein] reductase [Chloroflexi bacterium]|jgi:3-oxoacyl-[acyl-carrier protein] reductase|nr:3-oxoacyl-[acyl-carrier-protein] reductase [Chloroflexota bacterium]MDP6498032.1 3-oxoacyl-[acyl-carrier-protein] reductase [Dehalococcoidia bacterium]MQG10801.1 3-oxoacyl-[acyl-carrier-protein] reductase [SAR202 cluster bacterium]MQG53726.1 3-oxoacyl-[acyl-carrier-protein] reductase [SAR202 cluster bacterium]|tara:strand:- start:1265 stop:2017 length:753 start_codon:yes stop_codon:yes gene_type:complete
MPGIDLSGKVALVTGASRGIGSVVATRLAQAGAKVGVNFHASSELATAVVDKINKAGGVAFLVGGDVSQEDKAEAVIKQLVEHFGNIDILVNNAGINIDQLLIRMKTEDFDSVMNINLRAAFLCTRFAMTHMIRQRSGRVINMSSVVGLSGNPGQANYAAAKAGLVGLTKAVAREVASRNVTVNALAPGYIVTSMVEEIPEDKQDQILARIPMGRFGTPEDVAEAVVFLSSDGASYITGQVLTIDGGMIA